jgi:hypothetical protein
MSARSLAKQRSSTRVMDAAHGRIRSVVAPHQWLLSLMIAGLVLAFAAPATAHTTVRRVDGVPVPPPGQVSGRDRLTTHGDYEVTVANLHGRITVERFSPRSLSPPRTAAHTASDPACSEGWYNLEGPRWFQQLNW